MLDTLIQAKDGTRLKSGKELWHVNGRVLKGCICPASQIASHMQVNPSIHEVSLLPAQSMVTPQANWGYDNRARVCRPV